MAKWYTIKNQGDKKASINIFGEIADEKWYPEDTTPTSFEEDLTAAGEIDHLDVFINSPGGGVFAGVAIYNILKRVNATVKTHNIGAANSIASVIFQAGDERVMAKNASMMIHNALCGICGLYNAAELRKLSAALDVVSVAVLSSYDRAKIKADAVQELMDAETWMTAEKAVELGFADYIDTAKDVKVKASAKTAFFDGVRVDLTKCKNFSAAMFNASRIPDDVVDLPVEPIDYSVYEGTVSVNEAIAYITENTI